MRETPLIRAAHNGHLQMVRFLVEQGADVDCIDLVCDSPFCLLQLIGICSPHTYGWLHSVCVAGFVCSLL